MEQRRHREEAAPATATAAAPPVAAPSLGKDNRENKFRLDILKQKDKTTESAVASPEVNESNPIHNTHYNVLSAAPAIPTSHIHGTNVKKLQVTASLSVVLGP